MNRDDHRHAQPLQDAVTVNGAAHTIIQGECLESLLARLGHAPDKIATALNGDFVARGQRRERVLQGGDSVTCFQAIVGG